MPRSDKQPQDESIPSQEKIEPSSSNDSRTGSQTQEEDELLVETLMAEMQSLLKSNPERIREMLWKDRQSKNGGELILTERQGKIEKEMVQFQEQTAGPAIEQLRKSSKTPSRFTDIYGDTPENHKEYVDRLPEWARKQMA